MTEGRANRKSRGPRGDDARRAVGLVEAPRARAGGDDDVLDAHAEAARE